MAGRSQASELASRFVVSTRCLLPWPSNIAGYYQWMSEASASLGLLLTPTSIASASWMSPATSQMMPCLHEH